MEVVTGLSDRITEGALKVPVCRNFRIKGIVVLMNGIKINVI
jgi:hypothetical protein